LPVSIDQIVQNDDFFAFFATRGGGEKA
jgi:hypothetical protein